jgi:hypothetical protein
MKKTLQAVFAFLIVTVLSVGTFASNYRAPSIPFSCENSATFLSIGADVNDQWHIVHDNCVKGITGLLKKAPLQLSKKIKIDIDSTMTVMSNLDRSKLNSSECYIGKSSNGATVLTGNCQFKDPT